jgi:hypothetical protein
MQDGIKLLIDRMDKYPEEFFGDLSFRWSEIMQDIAKHGPEYLDEEDLLMLNKKVKEIRRKELNAKITEEIATQARLQVAQERLEKTTTQYTTASYGQAASKQSGQKVWWTDNNGLINQRTIGEPAYDPNAETYFGRSVLDMIERGQDNATLQNIRATNKTLEDELKVVQSDIAKRDEARKQAQSYKKRNNQNWK